MANYQPTTAPRRIRTFDGIQRAFAAVVLVVWLPVAAAAWLVLR